MVRHVCAIIFGERSPEYVITSYSIHYTKLYEGGDLGIGGTGLAQSQLAQGSLEGFLQTGTVTRISAQVWSARV